MDEARSIRLLQVASIPSLIATSQRRRLFIRVTCNCVAFASHYLHVRQWCDETMEYFQSRIFRFQNNIRCVSQNTVCLL